MVFRPQSCGTLRCNAFTLIELLVVVIIVGIVSSIALLSLGLVGDDRVLRQEARRMTSLIELAADEAVLQGRDFGLEIMQSGYRFVEHDPLLDRWNAMQGDELLRQRTLDEGLEFELYIEDRRVELNAQPAATGDADDAGDQNAPDYAPHALMLSSGEISPFQIQLTRPSDRSSVEVTVSAGGDISIGDEDERRD
ncbi:MAG: type II secretion system minor pseudopilin GspH [Woeseia sp.]